MKATPFTKQFQIEINSKLEIKLQEHENPSIIKASQKVKLKSL